MKNKYFKHILVTLLITALPYSCEDAYEIEQDGFLTPSNAFNTVQDLQSGLNGVYGRYAPDAGSNGQGGEIFLTSVFTDEVKVGTASNGQGSNLYNFNYDIGTNTAPQHVIWQDYYRMIVRINIVLQAFNSIDISPTEETEANHIKGQLLALRGLSHLKLIEYYAPNFTDASSLGVINVDFIPNVNDQLPRNTLGETLEFINEDFNAASPLLDTSQTSNIFINTDVLKALKTRLALIEGDYATALTLSSQLVANYPLANQTQYTNMYLDTDDTEIIFKLSRVSGDNDVALLYFFNFISDTDAYLDVSNELFNLLNTTVGDIRLTTTYSVAFSTINGVNDPTNNIILNKYPGSADGQATNDIKIFRASEMLLIKAEAEARTTSLTAAAASIKTLRDARFGTATAQPIYANLNEALTDILTERRKELSFEGHRFLDLKRLGSELGIGINRNPVDCASFDAACVLPSTDVRFAVPIPQAELDANNNIQPNPSN